MNKAIVVIVCVVFALVVVKAQSSSSGAPCTNDDFYIYNNNGVALRIDSNTDDVFVCDNTNLCNFISKLDSSSEAPPVFTEVGNSAFKTMAGSVYIAGTPNTDDATYDGLNSEVTTPQTFLWYGSKAAFRAGEATIGGLRNAWIPANIGVQSTAFGFDTIASGVESFAAGEGTTSSAFASNAFGRLSSASGNSSTANGLDIQNGQENTPSNQQIKNDITPHLTGNPDISLPSLEGPSASGIGSYSFGLSTRSNNTASTAFGFGNFASGPAATAWGVQSEAFGEAATSWGFRTYANDTATTTWGVQTQSTSRRATSWGYEAIAAWPDSTASGYATAARASQSFIGGIGGQVSSHAASVFGSCNTDYTNADPSTTNQVGDFTSGNTVPRKLLSKDYILQVGNGASGSEDPLVCYTFSSALTVLKNGDLYVAGNIYYGVGADPYNIDSDQNCKCLSADGSCEINSLSQQCRPTSGSSDESGDSAAFYSNNKRAVDEVEQLKAQVAALIAQVEELSKLIKA